MNYRCTHTHTQIDLPANRRTNHLVTKLPQFCRRLINLSCNNNTSERTQNWLTSTHNGKWNGHRRGCNPSSVAGKIFREFWGAFYSASRCGKNATHPIAVRPHLSRKLMTPYSAFDSCDRCGHNAPIASSGRAKSMKIKSCWIRCAGYTALTARFCPPASLSRNWRHRENSTVFEGD